MIGVNPSLKCPIAGFLPFCVYFSKKLDLTVQEGRRSWPKGPPLLLHLVRPSGTWALIMAGNWVLLPSAAYPYRQLVLFPSVSVEHLTAEVLLISQKNLCPEHCAATQPITDLSSFSSTRKMTASSDITWWLLMRPWFYLGAGFLVHDLTASFLKTWVVCFVHCSILSAKQRTGNWVNSCWTIRLCMCIFYHVYMYLMGKLRCLYPNNACRPLPLDTTEEPPNNNTVSGTLSWLRNSHSAPTQWGRFGFLMLHPIKPSPCPDWT